MDSRTKHTSKKPAPKKTNRHGTCTYVIQSPFKLRVKFQGIDFNVFTTRRLNNTSPHFSPEDNTSTHGYINIEIAVELTEIDGAIEIGRYARPRLLVILGILSFLTGHPFDVGDPIHSQGKIITNRRRNRTQSNVALLFADGRNLSEELCQTLTTIFSNQEENIRLIASLLDRWRKALFLEIQSDSSTVFFDDCFLAYFHVLELLATQYQSRQSDEAKQKSIMFFQDLLSNTLKFRGERLEQGTKKWLAHLEPLLSVEQSASSKIKYILSNHSLLDMKTGALVDQLVKIRNSIAHGQQGYRTQFTWPIPAFFPLHPEVGASINLVKHLSARLIAAQIGNQAWAVEWAFFHNSLHPPQDTIATFIHNQLFRKISTDDFLDGRIDAVRPSSIVWLYLERKIKFQVLENTLSEVIISAKKSKQNTSELFLAAAILADSTVVPVSKACKSLVILADTKHWSGFSNIKDALRGAESRGFELNWLRDWLTQKSKHALAPPNTQTD
ncbi:hypothetical protein [Corallococcus caeni]|uniref:hypothetical protein n=1 Tax=Corallococcus caeni TaxID=3082388 RepID=UPI0030C6B20A